MPAASDRGSVGRMRTLASMLFLAVLTTCAGSYLPSCKSPEPHTNASAPSSITIEFAEVDSAAPVRQVFNREGKAINVGVVSSITFGATPSIEPASPALVDGARFVSFTLSPNDSATFHAWTGARMHKMMGIVVGDQVYTLARIESALSGDVLAHVPTTIRSEVVRRLVEDATR